MGKVIPLKYKSLPGLSEKMLADHHDILYAGYVNKTDAIREELKNTEPVGNGSHSTFRELKHEETFTVNGVRLHEHYFDNMGKSGHECTGRIKEMIERDFGSYEAWEKEFRACGASARGWVVLAYDFEEMRLRNYICDMHNQGGVWNCATIVVLDVYEHAYFTDYATARAKYIDAFMNNVDWNAVNKKLEPILAMKK